MRTILLADDEPYLRELVRATLDQSGFRILEASDGDETLDVARREKPDLVILDWMMPERSGIDVVRELRRSGDAPQVIMLTAKGQDKDRELGYSLGIAAYLVKPFSPAELLSTVRDALP